MSEVGDRSSVLVVGDNKLEYEWIMRILQSAHYPTTHVRDAKSALVAMAQHRPDVVIYSWPERGGGADFIKHVRAGDEAGHSFVIVTIDRASPTEIDAMYAAGADDLVRRPVIREELLGRVDAPRRIKKWATAAATKVEEPAPSGPRMDFRRLDAFRSLGRGAANDLAGVVGQSIDVAEGWCPELEGAAHRATISLSYAAEQVEVKLAIVMSRDALRALGELLLGDPAADDAALDDVLGELANTAGGAFKRASLLENVALTMGIPVADRVSATRASDLAAAWVGTLADSKVHLGIAAEVVRRENKRVPASLLEEGMVVAHDLRNDAGGLLVAAGTRLTHTSAERVAQLLGGRCLVQVSCAA